MSKSLAQSNKPPPDEPPFGGGEAMLAGRVLMAATSKYLARNNKSRTRGESTKKRAE
jgi:hypothetical protein